MSLICHISKDPDEIESDVAAEAVTELTDTEDQPKKMKPKAATVVAGKRRRAGAVKKGAAAVANSGPSRKFLAGSTI